VPIVKLGKSLGIALFGPLDEPGFFFGHWDDRSTDKQREKMSISLVS
jgi:hypothetical protein